MEDRRTKRFLEGNAPLPPCPSCFSHLLPVIQGKEVLENYFEHGVVTAEKIARRRALAADEATIRERYTVPAKRPPLSEGEIRSLIPLVGATAWIRSRPPDRTFHAEIDCTSIRKGTPKREMLSFEPASLMQEAFLPCGHCNQDLLRRSGSDPSVRAEFARLLSAVEAESTLDEALQHARGKSWRVDPLFERRFVAFERASTLVETPHGVYPSVVFHTPGPQAQAHAFHRTVMCRGLLSGRARYRSSLEMAAVHPENVIGAPCGVCLKT